jgi:O-antigen/teichoic acid export membrane protein
MVTLRPEGFANLPSKVRGWRFVRWAARNATPLKGAARDSAMSHPLDLNLSVRANVSWLGRFASARFRRLGREFVWIGLGQAVAVLGAMVGVRILTGVLPPEAYGKLALGLTAATFVNQTILGPLGSGATRFFAPAREAGTLRSYLAAVRSLLVRATGEILLLGFILCAGLTVAGRPQWITLGLAALCFALLSGYNAVLSGIQNAARQRAVVALHQALASWSRFLLAAGMVLWLGASSTLAMLGYALAMALVLTSQGWFFRRTLLSKPQLPPAADTLRQDWAGKIFTYAWPLAVWGIPTWGQFVSDRWALQLFASTEDVGRYVVLYQLGYYPITIATNLVIQLVAPMFYQRAGDASAPSRLQHVYGLNRKLTLAALAGTAVAVLLAYGLHEPIFRFLVAPQYREVSWMFPGIVLVGGLFASGQLAAVSLLSGAQTRALILPKVVTALVGVLLNTVGAACCGMLGVVIAMAIAAAIYLFWLLWLIRVPQSQVGAGPSQ